MFPRTSLHGSVERKRQMTAEIRPVVPPLPPKRRGRLPQIGDNQTPVGTKQVKTPEGRVFHVLKDGFTVLGKVWYRGEEIVLDDAAYEETKDMNGHSWADLTEKDQYEKWDDLYFAPGPWPHKGYDLDDPSLTEEDRAKLRAAEEKRRQRAAMPRG